MPYRDVQKRLAVLIEPHSAVTNPEARQRSRLLLSILLTLLVSGGLTLLAMAFTNPGALDDFDFWMTVLIWFIGIGLYLASREGHTERAAVVLILLLFFLFTLAPYAPDTLDSLPFYVVIPLLLIAILFPPKWVIRASLAAVIVVIAGYLLTSSVSQRNQRIMFQSILFILPVGGVIWAFTWHQRMVEHIHREELEAAYEQVRASEASLEQRVQERTLELSLSQEALRLSEARQHALLSALPDIIFRNHRDGTYIDYHSSHPEQYFIDFNQFIGQKTDSLHLKELPDEVTQSVVKYHLEYIQQTLNTGQETIAEFSIPSEGQTTTYEARMVVSGPDEVLTIVRNISERKRLQDQTITLIAERERIQVLNQFVQNISHELRTPLSIISTGLHLISRSEDAAKRQMYARRGEEQVMRLNRLLGMTVSMTRLNSRISLNLQHVNLTSLLNQVITAAEDRIKAKNLRLDFRPYPEDIVLNVDMEWLHEAFYQVLDNAIRFTPMDGQIVVSTICNGSEIGTEIRDTGIGISAEELPHVFEHFWRQDNSHTTPGFGLGLTIAQKIVTLHGGRIIIESALNAGTTVRVLLPIIQ